MKKVLFIDRDGTIITEPQDTYQIDSFDKFHFLPEVLYYLRKIALELDYELVMVTNQDGMGTASFPAEDFWPIQNLLMRILESEGIYFSKVHIDSSLPEEQKPTRKPGTAMLTEYFSEAYDLKNSYVLGDRFTDVQLAQNLGTKAVFMSEESLEKSEVIALKSTSWKAIYEFLKLPERSVVTSRKTNETDIQISLNLDGTGKATISTGIGFFDHMLEQIARHAGLDLTLIAKGDLHIDEHHTIEDVGIALGESLNLALGNKLGIARYAFCLPMDDCLAQVALDFGGRSWLVWEAEFKREKIGEMPTEMFYHFFKSLADSAKCNLNIKATGENEHHKIEAIFKAFAKCIKQAVQRDVNNMQLPSTKGVL